METALIVLWSHIVWQKHFEVLIDQQGLSDFVEL